MRCALRSADATSRRDRVEASPPDPILRREAKGKGSRGPETTLRF
jgi:hypothetical protein